jgi:transposase
MSKRNKSRSKKVSAQTLPVIRHEVAGIDIASKEHWVCGPAKSDGESNVRVFGSTTSELNKISDWLLEQGVQSVAMESTSVYWIPIYELLGSRGIEVVLANARQLRSVPGRKTDMKDCQWLQLLHSCGLLRGSFRPDESICALRTLYRQCANLVAQRGTAVQWMQKALDQMNVQVHRAVTAITGTTGMAIVRAICEGERDPKKLAALRDKRCNKSVSEIAEHLTGTWRKEHLFNLSMALRHYDEIQTMIDAYEAELQKELDALIPPKRKDLPPPTHPNPQKEKAIHRRGEQKIRDTMWRLTNVDLTRIDGISAGAAQVVLTEVGFDLSAFPSEHNFISWLRLCPRTPISGGKPLRKKKNKGMGATRTAAVLRMAAVSLSRSKTALGAYFRKVARKHDGAVAIFATARKLAILIYRMLRYGQDYVDIGEQAYEAHYQKRRVSSLQASAKSLGFTLTPIAEESIS